MKVVVSAAGRFHAFHLAYQLHRRGYLKKLLTGAYTSRDKKIVSHDVVSSHLPSRIIDEFMWRLPAFLLKNQSSWYVRKDNLFDRWSSKQISLLGDIDIFVGWAHYWFHSLPVIKKSGALIVLESGSKHILEQTRLLEEEYASLGIEYTPVSSANRDKILKEYEAADYIMTPARHVYESFIQQGIDAKKLITIPYGVDTHVFESARSYKKNTVDKNKPFIALFVGSLGVQKGVHYLLTAWQRARLSNAQLWLVGPVEPHVQNLLKSYVNESVIFKGPLAREQLPEIYRQASVFVLPSIQEGLAMVQAEAMASGLPVIYTPNTGGQEFIQDGVHGFSVPVRDVDALAQKIMWCYENRDVCRAMGIAAAEKIAHHTWDHYGNSVIDAYQRMLYKKVRS